MTKSIVFRSSRKALSYCRKYFKKVKHGKNGLSHEKQVYPTIIHKLNVEKRVGNFQWWKELDNLSSTLDLKNSSDPIILTTNSNIELHIKDEEKPENTLIFPKDFDILNAIKLDIFSKNYLLWENEKTPILISDLKTLLPGEYLNDQVIDTYMKTVLSKSSDNTCFVEASIVTFLFSPFCNPTLLCISKIP